MRRRRCCLILKITLLLLTLVRDGSASDKPRRVLLLDSYDKEFAPFDAFKTKFRGELLKQSAEPLAFYELSVEPARSKDDPDGLAFLNYLRATLKEPPDLIVTIGGPAARFAQKYRDQLFASSPLLFAAVDERQRDSTVYRNSSTVAVLNDFPLMIETILRVLPDTKTIVIPVGSSPLDRFWREELGREFQPFEKRVSFLWLDNLSFAEIVNRCAALPADSAIFYVLLAVDGKGAAIGEDRTLSELHAKANAPIFGIQSPQLGRGVVGGRLMAIEDWPERQAGWPCAF